MSSLDAKKPPSSSKTTETPSCITLDRDELMDLLVKMRRGDKSKHLCSDYSITVLEEEE